MRLTTRRTLTTTIVVAAGVLTCGCGGGIGDQDPQATRSAQAVQPAVSSGANDQAADFKRQFEEQQRRNEAERQRQEDLKRHRRSFVRVVFDEIDSEGRVVVTMINESNRSIDDIRGGFKVEDAEGNYLASTGFTEGVPGDVFLAAGETRSHRPFISRKERLIERLQTAPDDIRFAFEVGAITYADGTSEAGLED